MTRRTTWGETTISVWKVEEEKYEHDVNTQYTWSGWRSVKRVPLNQISDEKEARERPKRDTGRNVWRKMQSESENSFIEDDSSSEEDFVSFSGSDFYKP